MTHTHGEVMSRRLGEPFVHIRIRIFVESYRSLGIPYRHDATVGGLCFRNDKLKLSIYGLGTAQIGNISGLYFRLDGNSGSLFAMVQTHAPQNGLAVGDGQMERTVMTQ